MCKGRGDREGEGPWSMMMFDRSWSMNDDVVITLAGAPSLDIYICTYRDFEKFPTRR